jgi:hypothetical protein
MEKCKGNVIKCVSKNSFDMYLNHSYGWFVEMKGLDHSLKQVKNKITLLGLFYVNDLGLS